jgi:NTE family protein
MLKRFLPCILALLVVGCASQGRVVNQPLSASEDRPNYSLEQFQQRWKNTDNALMLAFSGGGTRAAALSYGVLKELRDTEAKGPGGQVRLLDEIHTISSVSGGSFTAAYYGLYGERIFDDYEEVFLRRNVQAALMRRLLNPFGWFSRSGRTEFAIDYYSNTVFGGATFADMQRPGAPLILINATDFAYGLRFSFVQEYFTMLCSDLSSFPVARAVAASSAVPILFNPVVVQNYPECHKEQNAWLRDVRTLVGDQPSLELTVGGLTSYADNQQRQYVHFVDGGITDNLGLRAFHDVVELSGGGKKYLERMERRPPRRIVLISVNARVDAKPTMDQSTDQPSTSEAMSAMSDVQLIRYSADTIALVKDSLKQWAAEVSTPERTVEPYFILLDFKDIKEPERRDFFNQMPTSFSLSDEQVDNLIAAGGELLRNNPEFRRLMEDLTVETDYSQGAARGRVSR